MDIKNVIRDFFPNVAHNFLITVFNNYQYIKRHGKVYRDYKVLYKDSFQWTLSDLECYNRSELSKFIDYAVEKSEFYSKYKDTGNVRLNDFEPLEKDDLRSNLDRLVTINESDGFVNFTGGTTGTSTKNIFTREDLQKRHAFLDAFRELHGYTFGSETAWFSGKELLSKRNLKSKVIFKRDYINKINYMSTFHINDDYIHCYIEALNRYKPKFLVGFPSSIAYLAELAERKNLALNFNVSVCFPTAEKVTDYHRSLINRFYGAQVFDQYASSEGAPFITECKNGKYHLKIQTGVFEFVPLEGSIRTDMLVTSFSTYGTPLIRYKIGDTVVMDESLTCDCGDNNPLVSEIGGRADDYLLATNGSHVNLGNISNCTKNVKGISRFQIIQDDFSTFLVLIKADHTFDIQQREKFESNLKYRFGDDALLQLRVVDDISVEKSGKYRIIVNNLK